MLLCRLSGRFVSDLPFICLRHGPMHNSCPPHYLPIMPDACRLNSLLSTQYCRAVDMGLC